MNTASEEKAEIILKLVEQGYNYREIAEKTGIPLGSIGYYVSKKNLPKKSNRGNNGDRHLCKSCKYRGIKKMNGCDYIDLVGHSRGCSVEECNVYESGKRLRRG